MKIFGQYAGPSEVNSFLFGLDAMFFQSKDSFKDEMIFGDIPFLAAGSLRAATLAENIDRQLKDLSSKKVARSYLAYFLAIHSLAMGVRTNGILLVRDMDNVDLRLMDKVALVLIIKDEDELNRVITREVFEGAMATKPATDSLGQKYSAININPPPKEEDESSKISGLTNLERAIITPSR